MLKKTSNAHRFATRKTSTIDMLEEGRYEHTTVSTTMTIMHAVVHDAKICNDNLLLKIL